MKLSNVLLLTLSLLVLALTFGSRTASAEDSLVCYRKCAVGYRTCVGKIYVPDLDRRKMENLRLKCVATHETCKNRCSRL